MIMGSFTKDVEKGKEEGLENPDKFGHRGGEEGEGGLNGDLDVRI